MNLSESESDVSDSEQSAAVVQNREAKVRHTALTALYYTIKVSHSNIRDLAQIYMNVYYLWITSHVGFSQRFFHVCFHVHTDLVQVKLFFTFFAHSSERCSFGCYYSKDFFASSNTFLCWDNMC